MLNVRQRFDPLDLEIVERVYEVACAYIAARYYKGDSKTVFAVADAGQLDFDMLCDSVIAHIGPA
jgi:hypothetical protein